MDELGKILNSASSRWQEVLNTIEQLDYYFAHAASEEFRHRTVDRSNTSHDTDPGFRSPSTCHSHSNGWRAFANQLCSRQHWCGSPAASIYPVMYLRPCWMDELSGWPVIIIACPYSIECVTPPTDLKLNCNSPSHDDIYLGLRCTHACPSLYEHVCIHDLKSA